MSKYKFKSQDEAQSAQNEIIENSWLGATTLDDVYITINKNGLSIDLVLDIENVIKKHGGKAVFIV